MTRLHELSRMYATIDAARPLGVRLLADGTELVGRLPHVATEAWLHILFAGLSPDEIGQVEHEVGRRLDPSFAHFLGTQNGISLFSRSLSIDGLRKNNSRSPNNWQPFSIDTPNRWERPSDAKAEYLFVGGYESDGSLLYIDTASSHVYRCTRRSTLPLNQWPNFFAMLESEAARLKTLFDDNGRQVRPSAPTTPHIDAER